MNVAMKDIKLGDFKFPSPEEIQAKLYPVLKNTVKMDGPAVIWYSELDGKHFQVFGS